MKKETLIKMVQLDGLNIKYYKLGEEITELREELHKKVVSENTLLEIAQVRFLLRQLEAYTGKSKIYFLDAMLEKYNMEGKYTNIITLNDEEINKIAESEYKKNCGRLGIND